MTKRQRKKQRLARWRKNVEARRQRRVERVTRRLEGARLFVGVDPAAAPDLSKSYFFRNLTYSSAP